MSSCSCHPGADIAKNHIQNDGLGDEIFADSGEAMKSNKHPLPSRAARIRDGATVIQQNRNKYHTHE